ncbi:MULTISPECIES: helix-turn-helix domain-containing protein [unclassified Coleofasciculus]|uniref:helix-turn-helix domain-containing protein n=1 Tax=unclassified Coleofasciculus TaxID=2692782 RepID=UPI001880FDD1|nr:MULTISPECIES: RodZ domain-containing protein [unclassified Coleofasciculus]MBE9127170.1 helix-turn-helix domain-containing protein [Coleofasciculus sp. LEGE 07081]MBE9150491.1 helix-turn-helix domain-containing protein [Coleofasciculus sp. LEGE 07092]
MNQINSAQEEQIKEIGANLRQLREQQFIPIEEIATQTFIPLRLLKALESGQLDQLPEPIFIQGFIRRYADVVSEDGAALAEAFSTNVRRIKHCPSSSQESTGYPSSPKSSQLYLTGIFVLLITTASGLLYLLTRPQKPQPHQPIPSFPAIASTPKSNPSLTSISTVSETPSAVQITVSLKDESWLRVVVDGNTEFEGTLKSGNQKIWTVKKELTIRAGNAGAVSISFNQKEPKVLGSIGDVKEVTLTPESLEF